MAQCASTDQPISSSNRPCGEEAQKDERAAGEKEGNKTTGVRMSLIESVIVSSFAEPDEGGAIEYTLDISMRADAALDGKPDWSVTARYSAFDDLRVALAEHVRGVPFPKKGPFASSSPAKRLPELNSWLQAVVRLPLAEAEERSLYTFLGVFDEENPELAKLQAQLDAKQAALNEAVALGGGMKKISLADDEEGGGAAAAAVPAPAPAPPAVPEPIDGGASDGGFSDEYSDEIVNGGGGGGGGAAKALARPAKSAPEGKKKKGKSGKGVKDGDSAEAMFNEL